MSTESSKVSLVGVDVELRQSRRFRLLAPAFFLWERPDGLLQEGEGSIRDISYRGVFITGDEAPPIGAHIDVDVYLPSLGAGSGAINLHGEGTVVRVDREGKITKGFAAAVVFETGGGRKPASD